MNTVFKKEIEDISASYDLLEDSLENLKNKILQEYIPDCSKNGQVEEIQNALQVLKQETNYKKSPKTLVYSVIKILIKEDILENKENYKRVYVLKKSPEYISKWLKNI